MNNFSLKQNYPCKLSMFSKGCNQSYHGKLKISNYKWNCKKKEGKKKSSVKQSRKVRMTKINYIAADFWSLYPVSLILGYLKCIEALFPDDIFLSSFVHVQNWQWFKWSKSKHSQRVLRCHHEGKKSEKFQFQFSTTNILFSDKLSNHITM